VSITVRLFLFWSLCTIVTVLVLLVLGVFISSCFDELMHRLLGILDLVPQLDNVEELLHLMVSFGIKWLEVLILRCLLVNHSHGAGLFFLLELVLLRIPG